jgi:hypothetical protein
MQISEREGEVSALVLRRLDYEQQGYLCLQSCVIEEQIMAFPQEARRAGGEIAKQSGVRHGAPAKQPIPRGGSSRSQLARSKRRSIQRERASHEALHKRLTEHFDAKSEK